jgi:hypothetical protein
MVAISLPFAILMSLEFNHLILKIFVPTGLFGLISYTSYYFVIGHLCITYIDGTLEFDWKRKYLFNYKKIVPIRLSEIQKVVIDNHGFALKRIITANRNIPLNSGYHKDSLEFNKILRNETNATKIDSWDVWKDKGWLHIAYRINSILLIVVTIIVVLYLTKKGFESHLLLYMIFPFSQMLLFRQQMKGKLN